MRRDHKSRRHKLFYLDSKLKVLVFAVFLFKNKFLFYFIKYTYFMDALLVNMIT